MNIKTKWSIVVSTAIAFGSLGLGIVDASSKPSPLPVSGEFDQVQSIVSPRLTIKSVDHVMFKGIRYTMQSVDPQTFVAYTDIADGQSYYHYVPTSSVAMRIAIKDKPHGALDELKSQTDAKIIGMTKSGSIVVEGYNCDILTRDLGNGATVTMFRSTDPQFPYIIKTTLVVPAKNLKQTNEIDNIKLGSVVEENAFVLPKGTKIVDQPADSSTEATNNAAPTTTPTPPIPSGP